MFAPIQTQAEQLLAQLFAQRAPDESAKANTQEAPRFGAFILHQQYLLFALVEELVSDGDELAHGGVGQAIEEHCDVPLTVCFTGTLP